MPGAEMESDAFDRIRKKGKLNSSHSVDNSTVGNAVCVKCPLHHPCQPNIQTPLLFYKASLFPSFPSLCFFIAFFFLSIDISTVQRTANAG
jgi:hypothetical protein